VIYFIGAGSGDPDLITVKAKTYIRDCRCGVIYRLSRPKRG